MPEPSKGAQFLETRKKMRAAAKRKREEWAAKKQFSETLAAEIRKYYAEKAAEAAKKAAEAKEAK